MRRVEKTELVRGTELSERVTIKSIAKDLNISHMTVSRALSGNPNVQKETREKIVKRAKELGYVKSAAASAMRGDGTKIVGLLLPNIVNEFYARFANAMAEACETQSLHLIIHLTNDDITQEQRAIERLREVQAMAVVMVPSPSGNASSKIDLAGMKVIQLIRQRADIESGSAILVDDHAAIRNAVLHLAHNGHSAIGYIGASDDLSSGRDRLAAFRAGLEQAGLSEEPSLVQMDTPSFEMGRTSAANLIESGLATGLICGGVEISNGALSTLLDRGIQTGRKLEFVGYGDPTFYSWIGGGITTIRLPLEELTQETVRKLGTDEATESDLAPRKFKASLVIREA